VIPFELTVKAHPDDHCLYAVCWSDGDAQIDNIPEIWIDLIPFMVARRECPGRC